jgi:AcrR family transcriptional regulator
MEVAFLAPRPRRHQGLVTNGSEPLYRKLKPGPGLPSDEVARHQRQRLHGAMIEAVAGTGFDGVKVGDLVQMAGVSKPTFYKHFSDKQDCLYKTYDAVARQAARTVFDNQRGLTDPEARLRAGIRAYLEQVVGRPKASSFALFEASIGLDGLEHTAHAHKLFATLIRANLGGDDARDRLSPIFATGIVAAAVQVSRSQLLDGDRQGSAANAETLADWSLALCREHPSSSGVPFPDTSKAEAARLPTEVERSEIEGNPAKLILSSVIRLAAAHGYMRLTVPWICATAGISRRHFASRFDGVGDCFLAGLRRRADIVVGEFLRIRDQSGSSDEGIDGAVAALCVLAARDPAARVDFVDALTAGPGGVRLQVESISRIATIIGGRTGSGQRPDIAAEASAAAIWGTIQWQLQARRPQRLPMLASSLSVMVRAASARTSHVAQSRL